MAPAWVPRDPPSMHCPQCPAHSPAQREGRRATAQPGGQLLQAAWAHCGVPPCPQAGTPDSLSQEHGVKSVPGVRAACDVPHLCVQDFSKARESADP